MDLSRPPQAAMEFLSCFTHPTLSCLKELQLMGHNNNPHCATVLERLLRQARALMQHTANTGFALR